MLTKFSTEVVVELLCCNFNYKVKRCKKTTTHRLC